MIRFKDFNTATIFTVKSNPQLNKDSFNFSEEGIYPYFTRTVANNGILGYVDYLDEEHKIGGNSIAVGMLGMKFFYMPNDFYAGQFTKTIFPKFKHFNYKIGLYFTTLFNKYSELLASVLVRDFEKEFYKINLSLPVNQNDEIDFEYIEEFINEIEKDNINNLDSFLGASDLNNSEITKEDKDIISKKINTGRYRIGDIFEKLPTKKCTKDKNVSKVKNKEYCIPLVYAKRGDNGIMYYAKPGNYTTYSNVISIIYNGAIAAGLVYAQEEPTGILAESYFIRIKKEICNEVPFEANLYLKTVIQKAIYDKYSRDTLATWDNRVENDYIVLPVDDNNKIDFNYMENYIKAQQRSVVTDIIKWKNNEISNN